MNWSFPDDVFVFAPTQRKMWCLNMTVAIRTAKLPPLIFT